MNMILQHYFPQTLLPLILAHNPAGTSIKTLMHFAQEIKSSKTLKLI